MIHNGQRVVRLKTTCRWGARGLGCLLLCWSAMLFLPSAFAQEPGSCPVAMAKSLAGYIDRARGAGQSRQESRILQVACTAWPADPEVTLAVAAYTDDPETEGGEVGYWDMVVAMLNTRSAGIVAAYKGKGGEADAATHFAGYSLDTSAYRLASGVRAFGVIDHSGTHGPDCADGGVGSHLSLWIRDKATLRPVFYTEQDEWSTLQGSACATSEPGRIENAHMTVRLEQTRTKGFADLSLIAHVTATTWDAHARRDDIFVGDRRMTFKYDGTSYQSVPAGWWETQR